MLDVGTSKMCCLIARRRGDRLELQGGGYQLAEGLRAGAIVDAEAAEASILAVVHEAEQQAGRTVREIVLGISGGRLESVTTIEIELGGRAVGPADDPCLWRSPGRRRAPTARGPACAAGRDHARRSQGCATPAAWSASACASRFIWCGWRARPVQPRGRDRALPSGCRGGGRGAYAAGLASLSEDEATLARSCWISAPASPECPVRRSAPAAAGEPAAGRAARHPGPGVRPVDRARPGRAPEDALRQRSGARRRCPPAARGARPRRPDAAAGADRVAGAPDRDHPPAGRGDLPAGARAHDLDRLPLAGRRLVLTGGGSQLEGIVELAEETSACRRGSAAPVRSMPAPCRT